MKRLIPFFIILLTIATVCGCKKDTSPSTNTTTGNNNLPDTTGSWTLSPNMEGVTGSYTEVDSLKQTYTSGAFYYVVSQWTYSAAYGYADLIVYSNWTGSHQANGTEVSFYFNKFNPTVDSSYLISDTTLSITVDESDQGSSTSYSSQNPSVTNGADSARVMMKNGKVIVQLSNVWVLNVVGNAFGTTTTWSQLSGTFVAKN